MVEVCDEYPYERVNRHIERSTVRDTGEINYAARKST